MTEPLDFEILRESIVHTQVCTSLNNDDATARLNKESPSGISSEWQLTDDPSLHPVACAHNKMTHRHLVFVC